MVIKFLKELFGRQPPTPSHNCLLCTKPLPLEVWEDCTRVEYDYTEEGKKVREFVLICKECSDEMDAADSEDYYDGF